MIWFCADDYGLNPASSQRIEKCIDEGALNKVSVFPNIEKVDLQTLLANRNLRVSLHLNLVEGKCVANAKDIPLLAREDGSFKHTFTGLFKLWILGEKAFEEQLYTEIKAQVLQYKSMLPKGVSFCIDSHQHTYMIPAVFKAVLRVLSDERIDVDYMRIPAEPLLPFILAPSLYLTYSPVNIIKQWLLDFLWLINKRTAKNAGIPTAGFLGILFSGKMDLERVSRVLPKYEKLAEKKGMDIEVLFHPGFLNSDEADFKNKNIVFESFYFSENRKCEFETAMKISERSGL